jgi:2,3-bisphosphoglycerate-independent phosphoglycerate mutase
MASEKGYKFVKDDKGAALCDVAPTILRVMGLDVPKEMTGRSLLKED